MPRTSTHTFPIPRRFVKFALVGLSGVVVNETITGLTLWFGGKINTHILRANLAVFMGWATSVISNFLLNYSWTWKDRPRVRSIKLLKKLGAYYITATAALLIQATIVNIMAHLFGWQTIRILLYNLLGMAGGTLINFLLADKWVFRFDNSPSQSP